MQLGTPEKFQRDKERETESSYAKYFIHARGPVIWNSLLNETEKNILS